jgi:hypothetical protein
MYKNCSRCVGSGGGGLSDYHFFFQHEGYRKDNTQKLDHFIISPPPSPPQTTVCQI